MKTRTRFIAAILATALVAVGVVATTAAHADETSDCVAANPNGKDVLKLRPVSTATPTPVPISTPDPNYTPPPAPILPPAYPTTILTLADMEANFPCQFKSSEYRVLAAEWESYLDRATAGIQLGKYTTSNAVEKFYNERTRVILIESVMWAAAASITADPSTKDAYNALLTRIATEELTTDNVNAFSRVILWHLAFVAANNGYAGSFVNFTAVINNDVNNPLTNPVKQQINSVRIATEQYVTDQSVTPDLAGLYVSLMANSGASSVPVSADTAKYLIDFINANAEELL